jgi:hypothetical protein
MNKTVFVALALMLSGSEVFACTRDARICRDGSARGRDPSRNCEFWPPCPEDRRASQDQKKEILCASMDSKILEIAK